MAENVEDAPTSMPPLPNCEGHFRTELSVYEDGRAKWVENHYDEFVVIYQRDVAGFFPTFAEAYEAALAKYGLDHLFLIKQVVPCDAIFVIY